MKVSISLPFENFKRPLKKDSSMVSSMYPEFTDNRHSGNFGYLGCSFVLAGCKRFPLLLPIQVAKTVKTSCKRQIAKNIPRYLRYISQTEVKSGSKN